MRMLPVSSLSILAAATALPVLAGPDWSTIERARHAKQLAAASHGDAGQMPAKGIAYASSGTKLRYGPAKREADEGTRAC